MLAIYGKNNSLSAFKDVNVEFTNPAMGEIQKSLQTNPTNRNPGTFFTASSNDSISKALTKILAKGKLGKELEEADKNYQKDKGTLNPDNY